MQVAGRISDAEFWIGQVFASKSARRGAVVRRSVAWVHREIGDARFRAEVRQRGYHLLQTADQYIVICHNGPIQLIFQIASDFAEIENSQNFRPRFFSE